MKIQTKEMTLSVNALEDDLLSSVNDIAIIDVSDLKNVSVLLNQVDETAQLDLGSVTVNVDTVIRAVTPGALPTISFTAGALTGAGTIVEDVDAQTVAITFKTAVSTVADIEALLATSEVVAIVTAGTPANVLVVVDDDFAAEPLVLDAATFTATLEKSSDGVNWSTVGSYTEATMPSGASVSSELTLSDSHGMPTLAKQVKITLTAMTGASRFSAVAAGAQI